MNWIPSIYTKTIQGENGDLIVYNSLSGGLWTISSSKAKVLTALKEGTETLEGELHDLALMGFLVSEKTDEDKQVEQLREQVVNQEHALELTLLPTEQCNFRCTYCYESFSKAKMSKKVQQGIEDWVQSKAEELDQLRVGWFGGEPLLGMEVIEKLSKSFLTMSQRYDFSYEAGMTTNGYLLNREMLKKLLDLKVTQFQVTLDGPAKEHDRRRKLAGGGGTFNRVFANLKELKDSQEEFEVIIRMNFDHKNYPEIIKFLDTSGQLFKDRRFLVTARPIGKWGGPNDESLSTCPILEGEKAMVKFCQSAVNLGLKCLDTHLLQPMGWVCYAAKPFSFVIGVDGTVYKCTIAFDDQRNQVGKINFAGELKLEEDKIAPWIKDYTTEDKKCQECSVLPLCLGSSCPLARMDTQADGNQLCPPPKRHLAAMVKYLWKSQKREGKKELFTKGF